MKLRLLLPLLLFVFAEFTFAQKAEVLTNKTITDLVQAGLDDAIIVSKIESSPCKFDLSTAALVALKKEKVSSDIIKEMMAKTQGKSPVKLDVAPTPAPVAAKEVPTMDMVNIPHGYDSKANTINDLEKSVVSIKGKITVGAFLSPLSSPPIVFKINGERSPIRFATGDSALFLINSGIGTPDIFHLYRMTVKKGKREAVYMKERMLKQEIDNDIIAFTYKKMKEGAYEIIPVTKLAAGEYCLMNVASIGSYGGTRADVYAFGVE